MAAGTQPQVHPQAAHVSQDDADLSPRDWLRRLFVAALTEQSNGAWSNVVGFLSKLSASERQQLSEEPDVVHYVNRTLHYANSIGSKDHLDLVQHMTALFPGAVEQCKKQSRSVSSNFPLDTYAPKRTERRKQRARKRVVSLDSGLAKLLSYSPREIAATFRGPELQLSELVLAASAVSQEMGLQSKKTLSPTHQHPTLSATITKHTPRNTAYTPHLSPVYHHQLKDGKGTTADTQAKFQKTQKGTSSDLHNAYDVIAAFATGSLQAGAESVYLNCYPSTPWNPYSLTVVPKTRANMEEHYLISKFGILHVQSGESSDLQSFADWLREAGLFTLCQQIPFFRQFLTRKMFREWHRNVCYRQFVRIFSSVDQVGLKFFPEFCDAINKIHKLNTELLNMPIHTLKPFSRHSANTLQKNTEETEAVTHRLLQRYFKYCKRVVSEAIGEMRQIAERLEEEKKHQPFVSDSPISVQVAQHAELENRLGVARYRASRISDFVRLVEQMMGACLLQLARQSGREWVEGVLHLTSHDNTDDSSSSSLDSDDRDTLITDKSSKSRCEESESGDLHALLTVELQIRDEGGIVTQPSEDNIVQLLTSPLHSTTRLITSISSTLTALPSLPLSTHTNSGTGEGKITRAKPLLQVLKGITAGSDESRPESILESSRARSRLEGVQAQGASEERPREGDYSTPNSPLISHNIRIKLQQDPVLQTLSCRLEEAMEYLSSEVSAACQHHLWLYHTHSLINKCKRDKTSNMSAQNFEAVLGELHSALSRLHHLPPLLPTSHSLLTISTVSVTSQLEPQLKQTVSRLQRSLASQALETATQLLRDTRNHAQMLSTKRYDLEGFVQYARSLRESQAFHSRETAQTQWVTDVCTTLRRYSITTSDQARETLQQLQVVWAQFEASLSDGQQFVEKQTPIKAQGLQENISVLEEQLDQLLMTANGGDFIDPTATPHLLLTRLESIQQEMSGIRSRLLELSKWEEAITGKHHNLSRVFHCFDVLFARQELWKYQRQFESCWYDWTRIPFKRIDITYLEKKVGEWWSVCDKLGRMLPPEDPVLEQWREKVERMHTNMATLQLLSSRDIKTSHWHTIFAVFNEQYDPHDGYTLQYFLDRDLEKFSDRISEVHGFASQQSRLREKFRGMEREWDEKEIELLQTSIDRYSFCLSLSHGPQRQTTITFYDPSDSPGKTGSHSPESGSRDQLHSVERGEELREQMKAALLQLGAMLSSPHLGGLKGKVQLLRSSLQQVCELFSLLLLTQSKWQDLLELFLYTKPSLRKSSGLHMLQTSSGHLKEVMESIHRDPRLFSLLSKSRGRKGVRDLQGPELRKKLKNVLQCMEEVMVKLGPRLDEAVCHCPRLGYLTRQELLKALAHRGDPEPIVPLIYRVFPSIKTLHYVKASSSSSRDFSPGYQVTGVEGELGEHLPLVLPLPLDQKPAVEWLVGLERAVSFSLASRLTDCLATLPCSLTGQPLTSEGGGDVLRWLQDHVEQNVLLTLDMHWSSRLLQVTPDSNHLQETCSQLETALENTVQLLLKQQSQGEGNEGGTTRVVHALRSMMLSLRRKAEFARSLLTTNDVDAAWRLHVHYTTTSEQREKEREVENMAHSSPHVGGEGSTSHHIFPSTASLSSLTGSRASSASSLMTGQPDSIRPPTELAPHPPSHTQPTPSQSSLAGRTTASVYTTPRGPLQYSPVIPCTVHVGGSSVAYGFEYYGPTPHVVMTPTMECGVVATASAFAQHSFPRVTGDQETEKMETVREAARVLGRHHYHHTCTHQTSAASLLHLLHTALCNGSILSISGPHSLPTDTQHSMRHYLETLQPALVTSLTSDSPTPSHQQLGEGPPFPTASPSRPATSRLDWYRPLPCPTSSQPRPLEHEGRNLTPSPLFGCCIVYQSHTFDQSQTGLTGVACMKPDVRLTVEILLSSHGFLSAYQLSRALVNVSEHLQWQLGMCCRGVQFKLPWLKRVVYLAAHLLHTSRDYQQSEETTEMYVVSQAVLEVSTLLLPPDQTDRVTDVITRHFPCGELSGGGAREREEGELVKVVEEEMKERHLQIQPKITEKIVHLHRSLDQYRSIILLGPRLSGVSTCYRTLSAAYKRMGRPPANIIVINPAAYSWEQLIGGYTATDAGVEKWSDGILTRLLLRLRAAESPDTSESSSGRHGSTTWVVLDGPLSLTLLDTITSLTSREGLCLPGMEKIYIPKRCRLLLKPGPLPSLSPALVGSCGVVHWSCNTLTPEMLVESWLDRAPTQHDLTGMSINYLANVLQSMVPESLQYLDRVCSKSHGHIYSSQARQRVPGVAEILSLLGLLSAMLERNFPTREGTTAYSGYGSRSSSSLRSLSASGSMVGSRCSSAVSQASSVAELPDQLPPLVDDSTTPEHRGASEMEFALSPTFNSVENQTLSILCFAFIWSIGAYIPFSEVDSFNEFAQEQINDMPVSVSFPDEGSVFDYYLDLQSYKFEPWSKRKGRLAPKRTGYIPTPELTRAAYITEVYLSYGYNVLLLGERGCGKTSFIESLLQSNLSLTRFPITRSLTAPQLHSALSGKVTEVTRADKMRWGSRKIGMTGQKCLFFIDDLHLSSCNYHLCGDRNPDSPPAPASIPELISFCSHHSCLFDFPEDTLCYTHNVQYMVSTLPGQQYTHLTQLLGSFHPVPLFPLSDSALHTIFSTSLQLWFKKFPNTPLGDPEPLAKALSVASVATFRSVCARLRPSPTHPEWLISLKHLTDVFRGLLLVPLDTRHITRSPPVLGRSRATPTTAGKSSSLRRKTSEKSARKSSSVLSSFSRRGTARPRASQSVHLPPVKKASESNLRNKIKCELKGKKQQHHHDSSEVQATLQRLVRLWCHESTRVYADRMTESRDRAWFVRLLETCIKYCFCGVGFENTSTGTTTTRGGRPVRGARGRGVMTSQQSLALSMRDLMSDGVRADVLQALLPRAQGASEESETSTELVPLNQVITRGEDVTALIFCKLPAVRASPSSEAVSGTSSSEDEDDQEEERTPESVYQELGDGQVLEAMEKHVHQYSAHCARLIRDDPSAVYPVPDIVLFQQAMEHATRLCRAMIIPGCHALLLGVSGSGRKTLCRLVAFMLRAELFEVGSDGDGYKGVLKKTCSLAASAPLSPTVLLVSCSGQCRDTNMWSSITQIMSEGTCSGLFSSTEMILIQNMLRRDRSKKTVTPQAIARLVQHNLHVVIAWDIDRMTGSPLIATVSASPNGTAEIDPGLEEATQDSYSTVCSQCSVVDCYQTWGQRELSEVAQRWWREKTSSLTQGWITSESQLEYLAGLAAHIHLSSLSTLEQAQPSLPATLISPTTYTHTLTMAHDIAVSLTDREKGREERVCLALEKVTGGEEDRRAMERELTALEPELKEIERQLEEREKHIEACQERYKSASQDWIEAKEIISSKTETVESLRSTVAEKMDQVSSLHSSAMEALTSVRKNDVLEVMSYREPPASAIPVFNSLCMLFDRPQTWEECKLLLLSPNFFESLKFFEKDCLPRQKLRQLKAMLRSPLWKDELLQLSSKAVSSLALWVAALLDYHHARDVVKPFQDELATAEEILTKAQVTLVERQRDMLETKADFKRAQKERSGIRRQKADIEAKMKDVEVKVSEAARLLASLSPWKSRWEEERAAIHTRSLSSPGHALLVAAAVTYLSRVPADRHSGLWGCWLGYCAGRVPLGCLSEEAEHTSHHSHQARVQVEPEFSPTTILASGEERSHWNHYASFPDAVVTERCVAARRSLETLSSPWPLLLDPHQLFRHYAHELELHCSDETCTSSSKEIPHLRSQQPASCVEVVRVSSPGWIQRLCELEETRLKAVVLILDKAPSYDDRHTLRCLLKRQHEVLKGSPGQPVSPQKAFRLYLVLEERVSSCPSPALQSLCLSLLDFTVVDLELSTKALEAHLLKHTLRVDHPEYAVRHRALLVDRTFYNDQIEDSKERVIALVINSTSVLEHPAIADVAEESLHSEASALDNIQDTDKALVRSRALVNSYRPLSVFSALVFTTAQRLCQTLNYNRLSLEQFQELVATLLARHRNTRSSDDPAACHEHTALMQRKILLELHQLIMLPRQHLLLPLLVGLAQLVAAGEVSSEEQSALAEDPTLLQHQLSISTESGLRPTWLSQQGWSGAHLLEKLPVFQGLVSSLNSHSEEWREYCEREELCLTAVTPLNPSSPLLTAYHTMLLLAALTPQKFHSTVEEFISVTLGPKFTTEKTPPETVNHSRELLADVRLLVGPPSPPSLQPSLHQLLPTPLPRDELTTLAPSNHSQQSPEAFLYDELLHTNSLLASLHSSLQSVEDSSTHHSVSSSQATQALAEIAHNTIPHIWDELLPSQLASLPSLLTLTRLLHRGMEYLASMNRSELSLPLELHPLWVSNPSDLISRTQHWVAERHQLSPNDIMLLTQVDDGSESDSQDHILGFHGLYLCGTTAASGHTPSSTPVRVTLTPHRAIDHTHQCPVYINKDRHCLLFHVTFHVPIHAFLHCQLH